MPVSNGPCPQMGPKSCEMQTFHEKQDSLRTKVHILLSHNLNNNRTGFDQGNVARTLDGAQSPNKETIDSILDGDNHSTNETPTNKDAATETNATYQPPSSAQFRITVETNEEGVVVLDGKLVPSMSHTRNSTGLIMHIFFQETTVVCLMSLLRTIFKILLID